MCFGGKPKEPYNAYKSGDFQRWQRRFDKISEIELAAARGDISEAEAERQIESLRGQPVAQPSPPVSLAPTSPQGAVPASSLEYATDYRGGTLAGTPFGGMAQISAPQGLYQPTAPALPDAFRALMPNQGGGSISSLENKIKEDPSAAMELRELQRQHQINLGKIGIDQAFSKFDNDYYKGYRDDYTGYYFPQLERQYDQVVDKMTAALAGRGILASSVGANKFGDLAREHADARTNIQSEALDAANKLRGQVENAKSNLYSLNEASADPQAVNAQAVGQATSLVAPPTYSPLGQVFAGALDSFGNYMAARRNRPSRGYTSPYPTGYGSGMVVG